MPFSLDCKGTIAQWGKLFIAKVSFIMLKFSSKHKDISDLKTLLDYFAHPARNYEDEIFCFSAQSA